MNYIKNRYVNYWSQSYVLRLTLNQFCKWSFFICTVHPHWKYWLKTKQNKKSIFRIFIECQTWLLNSPSYLFGFNTYILINYSTVEGQVACQLPIYQQGSSAWGKWNLSEDKIYMHNGRTYSIAIKYEYGTLFTILLRIVLFGIALFYHFCKLRHRY